MDSFIARARVGYDVFKCWNFCTKNIFIFAKFVHKKKGCGSVLKIVNLYNTFRFCKRPQKNQSLKLCKQAFYCERYMFRWCLCSKLNYGTFIHNLLLLQSNTDVFCLRHDKDQSAPNLKTRNTSKIVHTYKWMLKQ